MSEQRQPAQPASDGDRDRRRGDRMAEADQLALDAPITQFDLPEPSAAPASARVAGRAVDLVVVADRSSGERPAGHARAAGLGVTRGAADRRVAAGSARYPARGRPSSTSGGGGVAARRLRGAAPRSRLPWRRRSGRAAPASSDAGATGGRVGRPQQRSCCAGDGGDGESSRLAANALVMGRAMVLGTQVAPCLTFWQHVVVGAPLGQPGLHRLHQRGLV